jgi:two-component system, OmpR family, sensor kinase
MTRHFAVLYLAIVLTLAAVSWGQDQLLKAYSGQDSEDESALTIALSAVRSELRDQPSAGWAQRIAEIRRQSGLNLDLVPTSDIVGRETLNRLENGGVAHMQASTGENWTLLLLDPNYVLALKTSWAQPKRGLLEWALTALFYAAIALVIMIWIWPLRRDLRILERAAAGFGNGNWRFDAPIRSRSQIYRLAQTFQTMALRIERLIASHKDMSNAVSHEIKTPLARMQFEIELAKEAKDMTEVARVFGNLKQDIAAIDNLVTAALEYAILERANVSLNLGAYNFRTLLPAISEQVGRDARTDIRFRSNIQSDADAVICDVHLLETVLRNLLYNAMRYARHDVLVTFFLQNGENNLIVEDDGPGIPEKDRERVFESFVQLERRDDRKSGFGLGLAIVKRAMEWHRGRVAVSESPLGGARFSAIWPALPPG